MILNYLTVYGLLDLIDSSTIRNSTNSDGTISEGIVFQFINRNEVLNLLDDSPHFAHRTGMQAFHVKQVGGGEVLDYRGYQGDDPEKGSGAPRSLQIDVGDAGTVPGSPERAFGYADLDCDNPKQGFKRAVKHGWGVLKHKVLGSRP